MTTAEVVAVLERRSRDLLGVSAERAIQMAEDGQLPDDLAGNIVGSWVIMAKGAQMQP